MTLPDPAEIKAQIEAINRFQAIVRESLIEGQDFGVIPGTTKPTLLKPGAEKITKLLGLADTYELVDRQEDWGKPFFRYLVKCSLSVVSNGLKVSEGMGECNSMEAKYRYRDAKRKCPKCGQETIIKGKDQFGGGWLCWKKQGGCGATWADGSPEIEDQQIGKVENEDLCSIVNTLLKMAEKRALVDAALHAGRLSDIFTQDIEDNPSIVETSSPQVDDKPSEKEKTTRKTSASKPKAEPENQEETIEPPKKRGPGCPNCDQSGYIVLHDGPIPCPECWGKLGSVTGEEPPEPEPEPEEKGSNPPQTAGELMAWVSSHGKEYTKSWLLEHFSWSDKDLNNRLMECYKEIVQKMGWDPR